MPHLAGAGITAGTLTEGKGGRPSWWRVIAQALLAYLVLLAAEIVLTAVTAVAPDWFQAVAARLSVLGQGSWPVFTDAPLASAAAGALLAVAVAGALWATARSRAGARPAFAWMLAAATLGVAAGALGTTVFAAVVTLVAIRQWGFRADGSPRPADLPRVAVRGVVVTLAVGGLAIVVARAWTDPLRFPPASSWDPVYRPVPARDLSPADRVGRPAAILLRVQNASPRPTTIRSVRLVRHGATAPAPRVVGLRGTRTGTWSASAPYDVPYRPVRVRPGKEAELTVLVDGPCTPLRTLSVRVLTSTGSSTLRLDRVADGLHCPR